jgi:ankyrin repeat protein
MQFLKHGYKTHQNDAYGDLYDAILDGDLQMCCTILDESPTLPKVLVDCGTCTPLMVALARRRLDIAKLFLDHGASTSGTPCSVTREQGSCYSNTLNIAISQPMFNSILLRLLDKSLAHEDHWIQSQEKWQPLHLAAAFNPEGLKILVNHIVTRESILRCVCDDVHPHFLLADFNAKHKLTFAPGLVRTKMASRVRGKTKRS